MYLLTSYLCMLLIPNSFLLVQSFQLHSAALQSGNSVVAFKKSVCQGSQIDLISSSLFQLKQIYMAPHI